MKKIFYLVAAGILTCSVIACQDEPKNPGDFSVKSYLTLGELISTVDSTVYPLTVDTQVDTVFTYFYTTWDSIFDAEGNFVERKQDTTWFPATFTTNYTKFETVEIPSEADTFQINIQSNARWFSPTPSASFLSNLSTTSGGGDSKIVLSSMRNKNYVRAGYIYVYTSDSTVMYELRLLQKGSK